MFVIEIVAMNFGLLLSIKVTKPTDSSRNNPKELLIDFSLEILFIPFSEIGFID